MLQNKQRELNYKNVWEGVLSDVELNISKANYNTWFKDTEIIKYDEGVVYLRIPNEFTKNWLREKYHKFILKSLREQIDEVRSVEYIIQSNRDINCDLEKTKINLHKENSLPLDGLYINKQDNLNPRYTFDNFVVGPFNELAYAASQAVIKNTGTTYNPLFIYGNTGIGKTHLTQAVGNTIKKNNESLKIFYVTSEKFSVDYVTSITQKKPNEFKEKYRKYDVLIMDDVQFLANKEKTQEELFHLFNTLYEQNKQIIFSSDMHPNYIPGLADRLKSRFGQGMIVDISQPDFESRVQILKTKLINNNVYISDDVLEFVATKVEGNIRDLEGILNTIVCQSEMKGKDLSIADIKNLVKLTNKPKKSFDIGEIIKNVSNFYNIDEKSIYQKTRKKEIVRPRQLIMYILREDFNVSYPSIGEKLGGRDHTTVIHSYEKVKKEVGENGLLSQELEQIRSML